MSDTVIKVENLGKKYLISHLAEKREQLFSSLLVNRGLDWRDHVESDASLLRPSEIMVSRANPEKSARMLGWQATYRMKDVARMMVKEFTS